MKKAINIKKIYSMLLLLVFIFSVVPRIHIHELVADHNDISFHQPSEGKVFSKAGINCHFEKFAAESPFVDHAAFTVQELYLHHSITTFPNVINRFFSFILELDNKGPPIV